MEQVVVVTGAEDGLGKTFATRFSLPICLATLMAGIAFALQRYK